MYSYTVTWSEEDKEYVGLCDQFPSLSHLAHTAPEAFNGIFELVTQILEGNYEVDGDHF